jgi:hypothetical protein
MRVPLLANTTGTNGVNYFTTTLVGGGIGTLYGEDTSYTTKVDISTKYINDPYYTTSFVSGHFLGFNDVTTTWTSIYGVLNKFFTTTSQQSLMTIGNPYRRTRYTI